VAHWPSFDVESTVKPARAIAAVLFVSFVVHELDALALILERELALSVSSIVTTPNRTV